MSDQSRPLPGSIVWHDLTVSDASGVRDFYCRVVGWGAQDHPVDDYVDYDMKLPEDNSTIAGICHARGSNAKLPPQWLIYITVDDVDKSAAVCLEAGGKVIDGPRDMGGYRFCAIEDPAGAVCALISSQ